MEAKYPNTLSIVQVLHMNNDLCSFFGIPNSDVCPQTNIPLTHSKINGYINEMPLCQQLLMVLVEQRNSWDLKDLAFRFGIDTPSVSIVFRARVDYMYRKLGSLAVWPHRDIIVANMPDKVIFQF